MTLGSGCLRSCTPVLRCCSWSWRWRCRCTNRGVDPLRPGIAGQRRLTDGAAPPDPTGRPSARRLLSGGSRLGADEPGDGGGGFFDLVVGVRSAGVDGVGDAVGQVLLQQGQGDGFEGLVAAATWVSTSMQYVSSSTIRCSPRTCPSIRRSRFRCAALVSAYPGGVVVLTDVMLAVLVGRVVATPRGRLVVTVGGVRLRGGVGDAAAGRC